MSVTSDGDDSGGRCLPIVLERTVVADVCQ